jgi:hypothetical protein
LEDSTGKLANVPVLIKNYRSAEDTYPNREEDTAKWIFSRRFLIYDALSGIPQGGYAGDGVPDVVRWASSITLKVTMDPEEADPDKKLLRPYLIIDYRERDVTTISAGEQVQASLRVDYFSNYDSTITGGATALGILSFAALCFAALRICTFFQRNPRAALRDAEGASAHLLAILYYLLDMWSRFMFAMLFVATLYIYGWYKGQESAALLLPELGDASGGLY